MNKKFTPTIGFYDKKDFLYHLSTILVSIAGIVDSLISLFTIGYFTSNLRLETMSWAIRSHLKRRNLKSKPLKYQEDKVVKETDHYVIVATTFRKALEEGSHYEFYIRKDFWNKPKVRSEITFMRAGQYSDFAVKMVGNEIVKDRSGGQLTVINETTVDGFYERIWK